MLEIDQILELEQHHPTLKSGVYFLIENKTIVYIGQSVNIISRIASHLENKKFDYYSFIEIKNEHQRMKREREYIYLYRPKYNKEIFVNPPEKSQRVEMIDFKISKPLSTDEEKGKFRNKSLI